MQRVERPPDLLIAVPERGQPACGGHLTASAHAEVGVALRDAGALQVVAVLGDVVVQVAEVVPRLRDPAGFALAQLLPARAAGFQADALGGGADLLTAALHPVKLVLGESESRHVGTLSGVRNRRCEGIRVARAGR